MMEPNIIYTVPFTQMDSELLDELCSLDLDVSIVFEAIPCQVVLLLLLVLLIIRCNNVNLLPNFRQLFRKLVDHHSEPTHGAPCTNLRRHEGNRSQIVAFN